MKTIFEQWLKIRKKVSREEALKVFEEQKEKWSRCNLFKHDYDNVNMKVMDYKFQHCTHEDLVWFISRYYSKLKLLEKYGTEL